METIHTIFEKWNIHLCRGVGGYKPYIGIFRKDYWGGWHHCEGEEPIRDFYKRLSTYYQARLNSPKSENLSMRQELTLKGIGRLFFFDYWGVCAKVLDSKDFYAEGGHASTEKIYALLCRMEMEFSDFLFNGPYEDLDPNPIYRHSCRKLKPQEEGMNSISSVAAKLFEKTEDAMLVSKHYGAALDCNSDLNEIIFSSDEMKKKLLDAACAKEKELEERAKKQIV